MVDRDIEDRLRDPHVDPGRALNIEAAETVHALRDELAKLNISLSETIHLYNQINHFLLENDLKFIGTVPKEGWADQW